jgi:hypothetical protein
MIVEGVDALKGTIRPLSLDCPLIAVNEDNIKDRLLRALGHLDAIANNNDSLETIPYPSRTPSGSNGTKVLQLSTAAITIGGIAGSHVRLAGLGIV